MGQWTTPSPRIRLAKFSSLGLGHGQTLPATGAFSSSFWAGVFLAVLRGPPPPLPRASSITPWPQAVRQRWVGATMFSTPAQAEEGPGGPLRRVGPPAYTYNLVQLSHMPLLALDEGVQDLAAFLGVATRRLRVKASGPSGRGSSKNVVYQPASPRNNLVGTQQGPRWNWDGCPAPGDGARLRHSQGHPRQWRPSLPQGKFFPAGATKDFRNPRV